MFITRLQIRNFEGIKSLDVEPGLVTILSGANGAGKTSVLNAVRAAMTNRSQRTRMVANGHAQGLLLFELDNGIAGHRRVTRDGKTAGPVNLTGSEGAISSPQGILSELVGGFGLNPVAFLGLTETQQRQEILKVTAIDLPMEDAVRLSGGQVQPDVDYGAHPLTVLKAIEERLYSDRRDVNRDANQERAAAKKLRRDVPDDIDSDLLKHFDLRDAMRQLHQRKAESVMLQQRLRRQGEISMALRHLEEEQAQNNHQITILREKDTDTTAIEADITLFERDRAAWQRVQDANARDQAAEQLEEHSKALTVLIEETRAKPAELLASAVLPVAGLGIDNEGQITIHGRSISALSTGETLMLATEIAIATMPEDGLRVILVDGLEQLDAENRQMLFTKFVEAQVQVLATEVSEGELTVITEFDQGNNEKEIPF